MQESDHFPSIHVRRYLHDGHLCSLYEIGRSLSRSHLSETIKALQSQGYPIESLEFYEYGDSDTQRHLFVKLKGQESLPYFQLDRDLWLAIIHKLVKAKT